MINKRHILYSVLLVTIISLQINNASPPHKRMMNEDYDKLTKKESAQQHVPQSIDLVKYIFYYYINLCYDILWHLKIVF